MRAIFFDLETSDKYFIGQILNYAFIVTDEQLEIKAELCGEIKLSRLQIPSPGALLANRINILEHQAKDLESEPIALRKIHDFLTQIVDCEQSRVVLIGFNSARFDLQYLRTSFIRNGLNPYFGGRLEYRDLLFAGKKLAVSHTQFPRACRFGANGDDKKILSLSLETLSHELGLLSGPQEHESRFDTLLSIKLARCFRERFGLDPLTYNAYEAIELHKPSSESTIVGALWPEYDLEKNDRSSLSPMFLLSFTNRAALWVNLTRYKAGEGRKSISWLSPNHQLISAGPLNDPELVKLAGAARQEFKELTPQNFFPPSTCDIEQDIYRIKPEAINDLHEVIWRENSSLLAKIKSVDLRVLLKRYEIANFHLPEKFRQKLASSGNPEVRQLATNLRKFALRRYGGKCQLSKTLPEDTTAENFAPSLVDTLAELDQLLTNANQEDLTILSALREYISRSEIYQVAGTDLINQSVPAASNKETHQSDNSQKALSKAQNSLELQQ